VKKALSRVALYVGLAALLLIPLYPGIAYVNGRFADAAASAELASGAELPATLRIVYHHLRRGWYRSTFEANVAVDAGAAPGLGQDALITVRGVIHHGPVAGFGCFGVARTDITVDLSDAVRRTLKPAFGDDDPLVLSVCSGYFGGRTVTLSSPKFRAPLDVGTGTLDSAGFRFVQHLPQGGASITADGGLPRLTFVRPNGDRAELTGLTLTSRQTRVQGSLYDGEARCAIAELSATTAGGKTEGRVTGLDSRVQSTSHDGTMNYRYSVAVGAVQTPTLSLQSAVVDLSFNHLDIAALNRFADALAAQNKDTSLSHEARAAAVREALGTLFRDLMAKAPELRLERAALQGDAGRAEIKGAVHLPGLDLGDLALPLAAMKKADGEFEVYVDDGALKYLPGGAAALEAELAALATDGAVRRESGHTTTTLRLRGGEVTLNDRPFGAPLGQRPVSGPP
jgi:uncharacterized protein YdgA (DUF945 family)